MIVTLIVTVFCGWLMPKVNVNSDMTKYLPNNSQMKRGVEILSTDFAGNQLQAADVKAMFNNIFDKAERDTIAAELAALDEVQFVSYEVSADSAYTLYNMVVAKSIDQKAFGKSIRDTYGKEVIVETSQDGATPPISALVIAGVLVLIILLLMSQSWLDPLIALLTTGFAVIINIGTNAFLPSVSITTNYIVAILQLVLSLDYAIILMNRFRQEMKIDDSSVLNAANRSVKLAFRPIMSSALTTIVGLLMLSFMRLKIGLDLGIVLAKGVVCSLICTFTLLPAMLLFWYKGIVSSAKPTPYLPTDKLGRFATNHKISMAIFFVLLFGSAFYFSQRTDIYFSTNGESQISQVFPKINPIVVVYDTEDEMSVIPLAQRIPQMASALDTATGNSYVTNILSYPTLLKQQFTAEECANYVKVLSGEMSDYMSNMDISLVTPDALKMVYYLRSKAGDTLHIRFPEMMSYISEECLSNPLFADAIDDNMRSQMQLLQTMLNNSTIEDDEEDDDMPLPVVHQRHTTPVELPAEKPVTAPSATAAAPAAQTAETAVTHSTPVPAASDQIPLNVFIDRLYQYYPTDSVAYLVQLLDTTILRKELNVKHMAELIGSSAAQTKMVYSLSKNGKRMTPLEYVHFLSDDLFNRKSLASFVNEEQKNGLRLRTALMDFAIADGKTSAKQIAQWMTQYGLDLSESQVRAIAGLSSTASATPLPAAANSESTESAVASSQTAASASKTTASTAASTSTKKTTKPVVKKTQAERQAEAFDKLMRSDKAYTYTEMAQNFKKLGQDIDPETVSLLYATYGSARCYNDSMRVSPEQLLTYVADTLVRYKVLAGMIDEPTQQAIADVQTQLDNAIKQMRHSDYSIMAIITTLPDESDDSYAFVDELQQIADESLEHEHYLVGESVMFSEMKTGFNHEMTVVTILTILAIFIIVAISFRSLIVPTILVLTVLTAVYVNVVVSGLVTGQMLYLAYLIVQSILMGATIDYGILYTNYYRELRATQTKYEAAGNAYRNSIRTILTSGLLMVVGPGAMALLVDDVTISAIVGCLSVGAFVAILLILLVLPALLVALDRWVVGWWKKAK
ncbi:MAG: MMPL family transporter [Paludibacteraceae bacterium]|nr:MMPL family transporter [Paludibacteraceae bacterium]